MNPKTYSTIEIRKPTMELIDTPMVNTVKLDGYLFLVPV
jgi:hypothetical protein